jgi:hypothetical protein
MHLSAEPRLDEKLVCGRRGQPGLLMSLCYASTGRPPGVSIVSSKQKVCVYVSLGQNVLVKLSQILTG